MAKPSHSFLPIWVIGLGLACALVGVLCTMMTEDIWSTHTSQMSTVQLRDGLRSVQEALDYLADEMEQAKVLRTVEYPKKRWGRK